MAQRQQALAGATVGYQGAEQAGAPKALYRDQAETEMKIQTQNLMYDRRVVRGSTFAIPVIPPSIAAEAEAKQRQKENKRKRAMLIAEKRAREEQEKMAHGPQPVDGRRHMDVQTETYLEVLIDREPEEEVGVQTDASMDRPPSPLFIPKPSGIDVETQILPGDLFDFDFEVAPLLDVMVGKTLEQALLEALQEDELAAIRDRQAEFEAVRAAELAEVQRLEAEVKRRFAEKQRRKGQEEARLKREADVREKVSAAAFARSYLASMRHAVFQHLHESGHFYDPVRRSMEADVLPGVLATVSGRLTTRQGVASILAAELIKNAVEAAKGRYHEYQAKLQADREAVAAEAAAAMAAVTTDAVAEAAAEVQPAPAEESGEVPTE